jgi:hypothetical protein
MSASLLYAICALTLGASMLSRATSKNFRRACALCGAPHKAHSRRKLYDVYEATKSPAAETMLQMIGVLFDIERNIRGQAPEVRLAARQHQALPVLDRLHRFMLSTYARILVKSTLADAINYALSR